jgi:hypothetical protein
VISYYVRQENRIYKFSTWHDLENYTGKDRSVFRTKVLVKAIGQSFKNCRIIGKYAAKNEGWIDEQDQPTHGLYKGNAIW